MQDQIWMSNDMHDRTPFFWQDQGWLDLPMQVASNSLIQEVWLL